MNKLAALALVATTACTPTAYYVANVYRDGDQLYTERCAIDAGRDADKPDPKNCRYERVHDLPPDVREHVETEKNAQPAPDSPPMAPPAAPAPSAVPTGGGY